MKTRIITVCFLFLQLLFAGCSKEEVIDNVDPDVPEVEIPEEEMEIAIQNLERVEEAMSPLFLASENAEELAQHLDEIKAMEGVEDAWVGEDAETLCLQIKNGGIVFYYYQPSISEPISYSNPNIKEIGLQSTRSSNLTPENKNVCIINQQFNDLSRLNYNVKFDQLADSFRLKGFNVTEIKSNEFTLDFLIESLPKYGVVFLITHGGYINNKHYIATGEEKVSGFFEWIRDVYGWWYKNELAVSCVIEKRERLGNVGFYNVYYLCVNEDYLDKYMHDFPNNSILFSNACHTMDANPDLWNILNKKNLGCYLGFNNEVSIGQNSGIAFFYNLLSGKNVATSYNTLPENLKIEKRPDTGTATLHCLPSDCQITLFGEPEVTDEEAVDLGLNVKWAKKNLGASNYTDKGNSYEDYDYMDIYYEDPILVGEDGEDVNLSGNEKYDYARKELGGSWRMPTFKDWQELKEKCTWKTATIDDKPGFLVTGPNGKNIFLPGKQYQQPVMGIQYYDGLYATGTLNQVGLRSFYIVGSMDPYGINTCQIEDMWIADTAFIRPVCD